MYIFIAVWFYVRQARIDLLKYFLSLDILALLSYKPWINFFLNWSVTFFFYLFRNWFSDTNKHTHNKRFLAEGTQILPLKDVPEAQKDYNLNSQSLQNRFLKNVSSFLRLWEVLLRLHYCCMNYWLFELLVVWTIARGTTCSSSNNQ